MFEYRNFMGEYGYLCTRRRTQTQKESKRMRILYVNGIREIQDGNRDLCPNRFKAVKTLKPVPVKIIRIPQK